MPILGISASAQLSADTGGGGGEDYVAEAVHFGNTGSEYLYQESEATTTDSPLGMVSYWFKGDHHEYPIRTYLSANIQFRIGFGAGSYVYLADSTDTNRSQINFNLGSVNPDWNHLIYRWDVGHNSGSRIHQLYFNGAPVDFTLDAVDAGTSFNINYTDAWDMFDQFTMDVADFAFYCGQGLDLDVTANREKFRTAAGKPADPSGFPSGATFLFTGDAASFVVNQGDGGPFTPGGEIADATTSPSD